MTKRICDWKDGWSVLDSELGFCEHCEEFGQDGNQEVVTFRMDDEDITMEWCRDCYLYAKELEGQQIQECLDRLPDGAL